MAAIIPAKLQAELQQKEALLEVHARAVDSDASSGGDAGFSWLTALGFIFLTFNSGMAIYRSNGDPSAVAFVAFSYLDLVLLFLCLRFFEKGSREACWKAKNLDLGVMATSIGSAVLLHCLTMRPSTEGADGGVRSTASLLLAFSIFLCGTALTLLNLSGNVRPDAAATQWRSHDFDDGGTKYKISEIARVALARAHGFDSRTCRLSFPGARRLSFPGALTGAFFFSFF